MKTSIAIVLFLVLILQPTPANNNSAPEIPKDVTLGEPRVWGYDRVYPLLDGLFQDVAATQLAQLTLNPNASNAANLDAIQNVFQLAVSYGQTVGSQNALAQQLNGTVSANSSLQTQLIGMEGPLIQSAIAAQQQVASAQALVDQLANSTTATAEQQSAAAMALKTATDNLNGITSQLTTIKNQLGTVSSSPTSYVAPSTAAQSNTPTLPTGLTNLTAPPGSDKNTPSFPSSKQMDNQINLLWERLARLVSSLAQPDNLQGYSIDLVELNVSITPVNRKKELFGVEYELTCQNCSDGKPLAIDLFPSASAVNIIDTKYRENRIGLAAVLSWFTVGLNASYNRDHLKMSQALGQSGYITGFGVGQSKFGWIFGRNIGDDVITPGNRTLFALVAVPKTESGTPTFSIRATRAEWFKDQSEKGLDGAKLEDCAGQFQPPKCSSPYSFDANSGRRAGAAVATANSVQSIAYAPADFDPTGATKSAVSLAIGTKLPIDSQQTISINGKLMKRSRDSFGRGIASGGSNGLLETATLDTNSWVPTGSRSFMLTLDPSQFGRRFPDIRVTAPSGSYSAREQLKQSGANISLDGREFDCADTCAIDLPAVGYPKASTKQLLVAPWHKTSDAILLSVVDEGISNSLTPSSGTGAVPSLQVVSGSTQQSWGGDAVVLARIGAKTYRLDCAQAGSRLVCNTPPKLTESRPFDNGLSFEVIDPDHAGGALRAWQTLPACVEGSGGKSNCSPPLVWSWQQPVWGKDGGKLMITFHLQLINMKPDQRVSLWGGFSNQAKLSEAPCPAATGEFCDVDLTIEEPDYTNVTDSMLVKFSVDGSQPAQLRNFRSITQPVLSGIDDTQTILSGQNLFFSKLEVGDEKAIQVTMSCSDSGVECRIKEYPKTAEGYLYFLTDVGRIPVFISKNNTLTAVYRKSSAAPPPAGGAGAVAPNVPNPPPPKPAAQPIFPGAFHLNELQLSQ